MELVLGVEAAELIETIDEVVVLIGDVANQAFADALVSMPFHRAHEQAVVDAGTQTRAPSRTRSFLALNGDKVLKRFFLH